MTAWLFPGQGSQRRGMGEELLAQYPHLVAVADELLGYSVAELCLEDPHGRLSDTRYAQPALFVVCALAGQSRLDRGEEPSCLAGHSLGEYAALYTAGAFDFATGVRLVGRRAELMAQANGGGMTAVVRAPVEDVTAVVAEGGHEAVDVANYNASDQVVLSGPQPALAALAADLTARGLGRVVPLRVSAPFHSRYMRSAADRFAVDLADIEFTAPRRPVIANVTARPHLREDIATTLAEQIYRPVQWSRTMTWLLDHGESEAAELGPGTVLTELWRTAQRRRPAVPPRPAPVREQPDSFGPEHLGDAGFRQDHGLRLAYLAGSMYHGISSTDMVARMARAGLMSFVGTGGLTLDEIDESITQLERDLGPRSGFGMNLLCTLDNPRHERAVVDCYLRRGVSLVEASAYPQLTPQVVRWRFSGAHRDRQGRAVARHRLIAKVSRPEVAGAFLAPPPERILEELVRAGDLTRDEADAARELPVSNDICVESDSGGHTDAGVALVLLPAMLELRRRAAERLPAGTALRVGAAGGLGSPQAVAAAFMLGADFVTTGTINQCTPEAGTSDAVKDLLSTLDVQDTAYAPAGDLFEIGSRVQVVRRGTLFAIRANKLYQVYRASSRLDDIDPRVRRTIESDYFGRSFDEIWQETSEYLGRRHPEQLARAQADPKRRMALVFRWYFRYSSIIARHGDPGDRVNYQIHCGPAIGSFNRWVRGTDLEDWRARHVDVVAERLMSATAALLADRLSALTGSNQKSSQPVSESTQNRFAAAQL